jgi:hypothetical protein
VSSSAEAAFGGVAANGANSTASIDNSITLGNVAVNTSLLSASVSGNTVDVSAGYHAEQAAGNAITDSFGEAAGISVVGQNLGHNSLIQQNVNVQANIDALGGGGN